MDKTIKTLVAIVVTTVCLSAQARDITKPLADVPITESAEQSSTPVYQLQAIKMSKNMPAKALINGMWYTVGETFDGLKVLRITNKLVVIKVDNERIELRP